MFLQLQLICTRSRGRTGTSVTSLVFETSASTYSAIRASFQFLNRIAKVTLFDVNQVYLSKKHPGIIRTFTTRHLILKD